MTIPRLCSIRRAGAGLIRAEVENAKVTGASRPASVNCHVYFDKDADIEMAAISFYNAKTHPSFRLATPTKTENLGAQGR